MWRLCRQMLVGVGLYVSFGLIWGQDGQSCRSRDVVVNVSDVSGTFVGGLEPASFRVTLDHQATPIISDRVQHSEARVILLLDVSGSISRSNHNWEEARFIAGHFVSSTAGKLSVALVIFSDHVIETLGFGHSSHDMLQRLSNLEDGRGSTSLYDSLVYAAHLFQDTQKGDALYVVTDGGDNHSKSREQDVERELTSRGIRLFWAPLSNEPFVTQEENQGQEEMQRLVEASGGRVVKTGDVTSAAERKHFDSMAKSAYDTMGTFYVLQLATPWNAEGHSWNLAVTDSDGKKLKNLKVSYPARLPVCTTLATAR